MDNLRTTEDAYIMTLVILQLGINELKLLAKLKSKIHKKLHHLLFT